MTVRVRRSVLVALGFATTVIASVSQAAPDGPVRSTTSGQIAGLDGNVEAYKGIPYAAPPVGPLRWRAPSPAKSWRGVRGAKQFGSDCYGEAKLRTGSLAPGMSEDCLYLNVWAPKGRPDARRPVMVWVYGGSFVGGTAAMPFYDGADLARRGVVVVTFNYRTSVFGFLAHPELNRENAGHTSGNYGLLDILAALRWVRANIGSFGGDDRNVTVFGESAGASAIGLLLTSPQSRGLFQKAILESPGLTRPLATLSQASAAGSRLGSDLAKLRATPAADLLALANASIPAVRTLQEPRPIGPIVDGVVLPGTDVEAFRTGKFQRVPVIVGSNADEGRAFTRRIPVKTVADYQGYLTTQFGSRAAELARCYPAATDDEVAGAIARLFGDDQFIRGVETMSAAWFANGVPVWRYRFSGNFGGQRPPASHGDEIPFVFGLEPKAVELFTAFGFTSLSGGVTRADQALSSQMMDAWTTFAKTGQPEAATSKDWPRYKPAGTIKAFGEPFATGPTCGARGSADGATG